MAQIAALLHRAANMAHEPASKEIKYLLPKPALSLREPRPQQWSNMVQKAWNNVQHSSAAVCKAQVLGELNRDYVCRREIFHSIAYQLSSVIFATNITAIHK